jgi:hypothetical protein
MCACLRAPQGGDKQGTAFEGACDAQMHVHRLCVFSKAAAEG